MLDELASTSAFSDKTLHADFSLSPPRSKSSILKSLFESLPALDAAYLTQIILKDLRPILYAPPVASTSRALLEYNTNSKSALTKEQFMKTWDPSGSMLKMYRTRANITEAALCFEAGGAIAHPRPRWGVPVEVRSLKNVVTRQLTQIIRRYRNLQRAGVRSMHSMFSGQVALSGRKPSMMASVHRFMYDFAVKVIHKSQFSVRARGTRRWTALQYTRMFFYLAMFPIHALSTSWKA